jgi:hypothetical protein
MVQPESRRGRETEGSWTRVLVALLSQCKEVNPMATACVDFFATTSPEPSFIESVDVAELDRTNDVLGYGRILKTRYDAEESFKSKFTAYMAEEIERFRDDHWKPKSHAKATITWTEDGQTKTGKFSWDEFVDQMFRVSRSWLNKILKSYHPKDTDEDEDETGTEDVEVENAENESNPLADRLEELEAEVEILTTENENLKAPSNPEDDELDKVAKVIKRHAVGSVVV